jgi:hypothetical protein
MRMISGGAGMSWKEGMKNSQYVLKDGGKKRGGEAGTTVRILLSVTKNTCFESTIYTGSTVRVQS